MRARSPDVADLGKVFQEGGRTGRLAPALLPPFPRWRGNDGSQD
ncbi:hypothetical protein BN2497_7291 [Janthinobacterium sp. CG23_2]|nr:hypothetical protein BN2497_7291 [Janthinobacterium sp. CG23_2]CUU30043.1 hypothetical protein BN3177_7291 [Janthinobacterium sp. CG23_2]